MLSPFIIDRRFWENRLGVPIDDVIQQNRNSLFMTQWVERLSPLCLALLSDYVEFELDTKSDEAKAMILDHQAALLPFLLVDEVSKGKRTCAMVEVARSKLTKNELTKCRIDGAGETFERRALMWRLYLNNAAYLELVLHLDRERRCPPPGLLSFSCLLRALRKARSSQCTSGPLGDSSTMSCSKRSSKRAICTVQSTPGISPDIFWNFSIHKASNKELVLGR